MNPREFQDLLDRHGAALDRWPDPAARTRAAALLAASAEARTRLERAGRLDDLCEAWRSPPPPPASVLVARAMAASRLPAPRRPGAAAWLDAVGRLGLGRWQALAFAACLVVGIVCGAGNAANRDAWFALCDPIDGAYAGDLHE